MKSLRGSQIDVGDSVYDEKTEKFLLVIARHSEQGSGPTPSRTWVAYEGNPRIQELDHDAHYVVKRSTPKHEDPATGEEEDSRKFPGVGGIRTRLGRPSRRILGAPLHGGSRGVGQDP